MIGARKGGLHRQIWDLMWALPLVVTGLAALHQAWLYAVLRSLSPEWHPWAQLAIYGTTGMIVAYLGLRWIADAVERREKAERELEEAYEHLQRTHRQLLTLHELGKKLAAAADVHEALALAARVPPELTGARGTAVVYFDPERGRPNLELTWGLSDEASARLRRAVEQGVESEACRTCQPLTARLNQGCPLLDPLREIAHREGVGSVVCLPVVTGERRVAIISTYLGADQPPSEDHTRALNVLATELASAMEGLHLRSRLMAALYATSHLRASGEGAPADIGELLSKALEITAQAWEADSGAVLLLEEPDTWSVRARHNLGDLVDERFEPVLGLARAAVEHRRPLVISRASGRHGFGSLACAPLEAEGRALGAIFLGSRQPGRFTPGQAGVLGAVASQVALAVRNAQLYHRLKEMALVEERYRLSREIHDGLAQTLGYLGLQVERVQRLVGEGNTPRAQEELSELGKLLKEAYMDVREAIDGLRATASRDASLETALRRLAQGFAERTGLTVEVSLTQPLQEGHAAPLAVEPEVQLQLLRIVQEALTNVRKHARARRVDLRLERHGGAIELTVADDGQGFDPAVSRAGHHLGLASMRERAQSLGGQLTVVTGVGQGTRVIVRIPADPGQPGRPAGLDPGAAAEAPTAS